MKKKLKIKKGKILALHSPVSISVCILEDNSSLNIETVYLYITSGFFYE